MANIAQEPSRLPDYPPSFLADELALPVGTSVTEYRDNNLQAEFVKNVDGSWRIEACSHPYPVIANPVFRDLRFIAGAIATIFNSESHILSKYVKHQDGVWMLASVVENLGGGPPIRIEVAILSQDRYHAQAPPQVPEVKYPRTFLSKILTDGGASVPDADGPAYDGEKITSPKLSLRIQFPHIPYAGPQFKVRFQPRAETVRVITRGQLAVYIAQETRKLTDYAQHEGLQLVPFERMVLMGVTFPSKASCQPTIGIIHEEPNAAQYLHGFQYYMPSMSA